MKTFNEKQILKHKTTFAFVAKTMTALSGGSHVYTENELRSSHLKGKDLALFFKALQIPYLDDSQELRFWVYSTDLKALRESFNYTQCDLAKRLGISQPTLCTLEKKDIKHMSDDIIQKVYEFYQHSINKAEVETEVMRLFKKSGLSKAELIKKVDIPRATVYDILSGRIKSTSKQTRHLIEFLKEPMNDDSHPDINRTLTFKGEDVEYIISLINKETTSLESQLQNALAEHNYIKISAIASELNKLSTLKNKIN